MCKHLGELAIGRTAIVKAIEGDSAYSQKLGLLGFTPGAEVCVLRVAPLGDPIQVSIRGYSLGLRRAEACVVTLEPNLA